MGRSTILTFSAVVLLFFVSKCVVNGIPGGRTKIGDVKTNKDVQELGSYSVDEYNRLERGKFGGCEALKFSKVVEAEAQVVSGIKYYLKIEAWSHGLLKVFDAEVVVKPNMKSKELLNFKRSPARK